MSDRFVDNTVNPYANDSVKPNVIWFLTDQMRGSAMSIAGDPNVHTPNLDRMARDGVWFKNATMGFPLCCPCRGSLLTGRYPHKAVPGHEFGLDQSLPTVADPFNDAGYHTAWLGKWHLDGWHEKKHRAAWHRVDRERRGRFKTWIGYENNNSQFDCWVHGHDGDRDIEHYRLPGHETDCLTDMLLKQVEAHKDEPFFHVCSVQPPHDPYSAPAEFAGRHSPAKLKMRPNVPNIPRIEEEARRELAGYYSLIEHIDHNVGRLMNKLEELGIADRTYVIFYSDHGDHHGSHGHLRKLTPYEESVRVPLMVWGGRRYLYNYFKTVDYCINHVDLAPTTLGLAGLSPADGMVGYDYSPVTRTPMSRKNPCTDAPDAAYLQCVVPTGHHPSIDIPWRGLVTRDGWKYVALERQPLMLFDLKEDPYEQHNMAHHAYAKAKRKEMNDRLARMIEQTGDAFRLPEFTDAGLPVVTQQVTEHYRNTATYEP